MVCWWNLKWKQNPLVRIHKVGVGLAQLIQWLYYTSGDILFKICANKDHSNSSRIMGFTVEVSYSEDSTQFNSSAPQLLSRQAGVSKFDSSLPLLNLILLYNHFARTSRKTPPSIVPYCFRRVYDTIAHRKQPLYCWGVFTAGTCLPSRCLAMDIHVKISFYSYY
jgi:hypothetical protein